MSKPTLKIIAVPTKQPNEVILHLQYTQNRIPTHFSLKKRILKKDFVNKPQKMVRDSHLNLWLMKQLEKGYLLIDELKQENNLSYKVFKSRFKGTDLHGMQKDGFFELWFKFNQKDFDLEKIGKRTLEGRNVKVRNFKSFDKRISFAKINEDFLENFVLYRLESNAKKSTILQDLLALNKFVTYAKKNKWTAFNKVYDFISSFRDTYDITSKKKSHLTIEERASLLKWYLTGEYNITSKQKEIIRIFVVMCYTGLAFVDTQNLKYKDIQTTHSNYQQTSFIIRKRQKSDTVYKIILRPFIVTILMERKTIESKPDDFIFYRITLSYCNDYLSILLQKHLGFTKRLTTHSGRHTFGMLSLEEGVDMNTLQDMMGHSDTKMTAVYAEMSIQRIAKNVNEVWSDEKNMKRSFLSNKAKKQELNFIKNILMIRQFFSYNQEEFNQIYLKGIPQDTIKLIERLASENDLHAKEITLLEALELANNLGLSLSDLIEGKNLYQAKRLGDKSGDGDDHQSDKD